MFLGLLAVVVLSLGTDQIPHVADFYPPRGEPMPDPFQNLVALASHCVYTVIGGHLAAKIAPHAPMREVWIPGMIGTVLGTLGVIGTWNLNLGLHGYPIAIAAIGLPLTLLGGKLHENQSASA